MKETFLFCFLVLLLSCNGTTVNRNGLDTASAPYFDPDFEYIHMIPDSLRTADQNEFLKHLQQVIDDHLQSENNELVFTLGKAEFVAKGIPEAYYILIMKDLENNNKFFNESSINVDSVLDQSRE